MEFDYDRDELCKAIYKGDVNVRGDDKPKKAVKFTKAILTSGMISTWYIDLRLLSASPKCYQPMVDAMTEIASKSGDANFIVSAESASTFVGASVARNLGYGFASLRSNGRWCGAIPEGAKPLEIEDLNTTYGTAVKVCEATHDALGVYPVHTGVVVCRGEPLPDNEAKFNSYGPGFTAAVTGPQLLQYGLNQGFVEEVNVDMVESYLGDKDGCAIEIIEANPEWIKTHVRLETSLTLYKDNPRVGPVLRRVAGVEDLVE